MKNKITLTRAEAYDCIIALNAETREHKRELEILTENGAKQSTIDMITAEIETNNKLVKKINFQLYGEYFAE